MEWKPLLSGIAEVITKPLLSGKAKIKTEPVQSLTPRNKGTKAATGTGSDHRKTFVLTYR